MSVLKILLNGQSVGRHLPLCLPNQNVGGRVPRPPYNRRPCMVPLVPSSLRPKWYLSRLTRFAWLIVVPDRPTDRQTHAHTHHRVAVPRLMIKILAQVKSSIARTKWYEITVKYKAPFVSSNSPFTLFYFTYGRFKWPKEFCKWSYRRRNSSGVQY